jgi:steroid delta-isomerase-like uncharacterized protein
MQATPSPVQRIFDQAFNKGDLAIVDELVAADSVSHTLSWGMPGSRMGLKQLIATFRTAFPDLHCTVEDEIREGDKFAAHWTMRGTQTGSFLGNPPTGRPVEVQGIIFAHTTGGQIVKDWILVDLLGILQQLGIVPPPRDVHVQKED